MEELGGRGMGRGRGRLWDVTVNIEDIIGNISGGRSVPAPAPAAPTSPTPVIGNGYGSLNELDDLDSDDDLNSWSTSSVKSYASSASALSQSSIAPQALNVPLGLGVNVPSRLLDQEDPVRFQIMAVDAAQQLAYVMFVDGLTLQLREELFQDIARIYKSGKCADLAVRQNDVKRDEVYVMKDDEGNFHRAMYVTYDSVHGTKIVDVDTYEVLVVRKFEAFHMTKELMDYWFQVIACTFGFSASVSTSGWVKENNFIFKNIMLVEQALLSMMEINLGQILVASNIRKEEVNGKAVLRLGIDVGKRWMKKNFMHSLLYYALPRLPPVGETKIGFITNVKETGLVDVVFTDQMYYELQEVLYSIQIANGLFAPQCPSMTRYLREAICSYNIRHFLAPMDSNWNELHRCKVMGIQQDKNVKYVKLHFLDSGKRTSIPLNNLCNLALPMTAKHLPELLNLIPQQAITLRVKTIEQRDMPKLLEMKTMLEGSSCIVKVLADSVDPYQTVEIFTTYGGKVRPLVDIVRSGGDDEKQERVRTPGEVRLDEPRMLELEKYDRIPLARFEKRLEAIRKKGRDELEAAKLERKLQGGGCPCPGCTESALEEGFSDLQLNVYPKLGKPLEK